MKFAGRTIGLILMAAAAASLLVAFAAPGPAAAETVTLCNADQESCSSPTTSVHEVSVGKAKLLTSLGTTECNVLFSSTEVGAGGGTVQTVTGNFTYTSCELGGKSCTATEENGPSEIKVEKEGHETGKVTGEGLVHVVCTGFIDCSYNGVGLKGTAKGPLLSTQENGEVTLSEQSLTKEAGGFQCPKTAKLDITTTPLSAIYISGGLSSTSTSLSTSLKGGGKEGAEITVAEGSKVKDTATLSGENASKAGGTLTYKVYKDKECKELVTEAGKVTVKEGKVPDSEEKELEAGAVYYWQAEYGGDEMNKASTSTCSKEVLTVKAKVTLATKLSGGGKEGEEITVAEGSKVKDQATLSGTKSSTATGTIKYKVYKDKECKELATNAGEGEVKEGKAPASEEKELEAGAVYYWQAEYGGDSLHEASTSACSKEVETVKANTSLSTTLSGGGKEGAEITVTEGSKVKDTATLSGTNVSGATGTVDYSVYKDKECKELATEAGKGKVEGSKAASSEEKELEAGVYYWQAKYLGDSLHEESTSTCSNEVLTVKKEGFTPHRTSLCTADDAGKICLEEHKPSTVDFKDSAAEFLTNLVSTKCEGLISGSVGAAGEPQKVTGEYKFSSCTNGCVVTEINGGSKLGFLFETSEKSTEELASATTEELELFYKCGETVKCAYGPIKAVGDALGALKTGDNGHITFSKDSLGTGEGLLCPTEASIDALFVASSPLYIREDPATSLCSKDEGSPVCKSENQLKTIDYKDSAVEILTNLINVKCEGLASGSVGAPESGKPLEVEVTEGGFNCGGGCFVTNVSGPGKIMLERLKSEEAKATAEGFEIFVKCGETIKCLLGPEKMVGTALGALATGDNGHLTFSKVSMGKGEGATCPTEAKLDTTLIASSAAYIG
jgi:hypothetical protein